MSRLDDLIRRQHEIWSRMQDLRALPEKENRDWTAEERTNYDAAEVDLTQVSEDIERLQRAAKLDQVDRSQVITATGEPELKPTHEERAQRYNDAFWAFTRRGMTRLKPDQQELLETGHAEIRAQGITTDPLGGYLVPEGFRGTMTETMKAFGGLANLATVITTSTGNDLPWPTNDDTGNEGVILSENTVVPDQDLTLGQRTLGAYMYTSKLVKLSLQLVQDSAFDLEGWLPRKLGERLGRAQAGHFATGTGINQPLGLTTGSTVGKTGAGGQLTSFIYDDLVDLEHSVDPAYRDASRCRYLMSDAALKALRKLKDGDQRPLWVPVPAPGFSPTINGWSYTIDNKMPAPAASAKSLAFGDFRAGYIIRQVLGMQMVRLGERYMDALQIGFFGFARVDAMVDDPAAIRVFQHAAS